jgi:hypothetical protein
MVSLRMLSLNRIVEWLNQMELLRGHGRPRPYSWYNPLCIKGERTPLSS